MTIARSLNEIVSFNEGFKASVNLNLNLNDTDKVSNYIPTKSSISFLRDYLIGIQDNKEHSSLLVGPYGKGKSHLLLVLLAIISMDRNEKNNEIIRHLINRINEVDEVGQETALLISDVWENRKKMLPVIITSVQGDLHQAFLAGINDALKRECLTDILPETYYTLATDRINEWEKSYPETYYQFENLLLDHGITIKELKAGLALSSKEALELFKAIYPEITAGSIFNPLAIAEATQLYKDICLKICEEKGYDGIYIVFDEFSKFVESQKKESVAANMAVLQEMCELANDSNNIYITMVAHKSIKEYGKFLPQEYINSFTGIEGRISEKTFITSSKNNYELIKNAIKKDEELIANTNKCSAYFENDVIDKYYEIPTFKSNFDRDDFVKTVVKGCYPLNPISAYLLLNVSEKVAQNERTLFTFISKDEANSMARYISNHSADIPWVITPDLIYDYFASLFKKDVANELVHHEWLNAEYAISRCTSEDQIKAIKTIAIILIVNKEELLATDQLLKLAINGSDSGKILNELIDLQLIYKKGSTNSYVFKTRAGSTLKQEIRKRSLIKGDNLNIAKILKEVSGKYFVVPKRYNSDNLMTRFFIHEYMDADVFMNVNSSDTLFSNEEFSDGKVITIISTSSVDQDAIKVHASELACEKLVIVCPKKPFLLIKQAKEYDVLQELKNENTFNDNLLILNREIPLMEEELIKEIENHLKAIYEDNDCEVLLWNDESLLSLPSKKEEIAVNISCSSLYSKTPIVNNELINKRNINTAQTKKARKTIVETILRKEDDEQFYSGTNQEATLYRSVMIVTGLKDGTPDSNLEEILLLMNNHFESAADKRVKMSDLINSIEAPPYGMRRGIIPMLWAHILSKRNEDIVVYFADTEIQLNADIVINMCENADDYSIFVSKESIEKENYIRGLNDLFHVNDSWNLSDNRIKNLLICMQRWFRGLPQVTKNLLLLEEYIPEKNEKKLVKKFKQHAQEIDANPYELFFEDLPSLVGNNERLEQTFDFISRTKSLFDKHYLWVLKKAVDATKSCFGANGKDGLYHVLKEWYEIQSDMSKQGLHDGRITNFMFTIEKLNDYDDYEITKKLIKATTDVYIENWNNASYEEYIDELTAVKAEIESMHSRNSSDKYKLSFVGTGGNTIEKYYSLANESTGSILRNILEDTLEEYDDLSVNDRVAILLEMIERVIK